MKKGKDAKTISANIAELMKSKKVQAMARKAAKRQGTSYQKKLKEIAAAIAYRYARSGK